MGMGGANGCGWSWLIWVVLVYLVDLKEAVDLTAFILLLLHFLSEALPLTLFDGVSVLEGPTSPSVSFPHIITGVTTPV